MPESAPEASPSPREPPIEVGASILMVALCFGSLIGISVTFLVVGLLHQPFSSLIFVVVMDIIILAMNLVRYVRRVPRDP